MEKMSRNSLGVTSQGIPSYDKEPANAKLVPLSNKFSALHDVSMDAAIRMCGGSSTSANIKKDGGY